MDLLERLEERAELLGIVDVAGSMQGEECVAAGLEIEPLESIHLLGAIVARAQGVDHDVADPVDLLLVDTFPSQVRVAGRFGGEAPGREGVGHQPVDLLRHRAVARAQARLDVGDGDQQLGGSQAGSKCRVHVPDQEQGVGALLDQQILDAHEYLGGLDGVGARSDGQIHVGLGDSEVPKEVRRHGCVVVLARMDEGGLEPLSRPQLT